MSDNEETAQTLIEPIAELEIQSLDPHTDLELDPQDIRWVFEKFGTVKSVSILKKHIAHIKMSSFKEMHEAITFINFWKLKTNAWLTVKWAFDDAKHVQKTISNDF